MTDLARPLTIAIGALGGQGGGVLAGWIVETAEASGYLAQYTSVPGVAQRTGATVYYVELFPRAAAEAAGRPPVLALMPVPGNVDVVIAAEWMEAGRAILRGFVTPDLTTLIASTHRDFAIAEKSDMADGIADAHVVTRHAGERAKRLVAFDMKALADASGSVISAVLFGALAGSGALPLARERYEETIRGSGRMVEANLRAFAVAFERAAGEAPPADPPAAPPPTPAVARGAAGKALVARIQAEFPPDLHDLLIEAARRLVDWQDAAHAALCLDRVARLLPLERGHEGHGLALVREAARQLALAMSFEDTIRVADLKSRPERFRRAREATLVRPGEVARLTEYLHPRIEEFAETLPEGLGRRVLGSPALRRLLAPLFAGGRHVRSDSVTGYLMLRAIARLRVLRRRSLRFRREEAEIAAWLAAIERAAARDYRLAIEVARLRGLVKGYGETHARGHDRFARILERLDRLDAGAVARLRKAAQADEAGEAFEAALAECGDAPQP